MLLMLMLELTVVKKKGKMFGVLYPEGYRLEEILLEVNGSEWRRSMEGKWRINNDGRGEE